MRPSNTCLAPLHNATTIPINQPQAFETLAREVLKKIDRAEPAKTSGGGGGGGGKQVTVTAEPTNNGGANKGCCK